MTGKHAGNTSTDDGLQPLRLASWLGFAIMVFWLLQVARSLLLPIIIAFLAFYLVQILNGVWRRFVFRRWKVPNTLLDAISATMILALMLAFSSLVARNATDVAETAPSYGPRITQLYEQSIDYFGIKDSTRFRQKIAEVEPGKYIAMLATGMLSLAGNGFLVILYLIFMLLERPYWENKLASIVREEEKRAAFLDVVKHIDKSARSYLGIKTLISILTALLSFFIMSIVGLDFAEFWAVVIFVLNFIPNIGPLIAMALPAAVALVQFESLRPFIMVLIGITVIQGIMGNVVEPKLMGNALNMSPLVVILSLVFWGALWGVVGMFLCVPVTAMLIIVFSNIRQTRWIAVLMSRTGELALP